MPLTTFTLTVLGTYRRPSLADMHKGMGAGC
jgi:hypothetical protein